jgi:hypothetical protein
VLKTVTVNGINGTAPSSFNYAEMMQAILRNAPPGKGLLLDDVIKAVEAMKPLEAAVAAGEESVTFSEAQFQTLREKLNEFQFIVADPALAEFGLTIRNASEITG